MITIEKGNSKLIVSRQQFETQFKSLGYQIASNKVGATKKVAPSFIEEDKKDIKEQEEEKEKLNKKYGLKSSKKGKK